MIGIAPPDDLTGIATYEAYVGKPSSTRMCIVKVDAGPLQCAVTGLQEFTTYVIGAHSCSSAKPKVCSADVEALATTLPKRKSWCL